MVKKIEPKERTENAPVQFGCKFRTKNTELNKLSGHRLQGADSLLSAYKDMKDN